MATRPLINRSSSFHQSLISSITQTLRSLNLKQPILTPKIINTPQDIPSLAPFSPHLTPSLVITTIKSQNDPYHALFFFTWSSLPHPNPTNYSHTPSCYFAMYDVLLSYKCFTTATQFMELHRFFNDACFVKLIKACGDGRDIRGAIDAFHKAKNLVRNGDCVKSFNAVLGVLVKANKIGLCRAMFDQVVKEGVIKLDVVSYTIMIRGYVKMGMVKDAHKVFDEMPVSCRPNMVTYNTMVSGYCRKGLMVEARLFVDKMFMMGGDFLPDMVTYTTLIDGYCKNGEMVEAMRCFDEMLKQGCEPNLVTYNTIVNGFCLVGEVDEARRMMTMMRLNGVKDDICTHTSLLRGLCVVGKLDDAINYLKEMISLGMNPDVKTYSLLVNECCRFGEANKALDLLRDMMGRGIWPSVNLYNAVINVYVVSGDLDEAVLLLKGMPDLHVTPNFRSYSTVISKLSKSGDRAEEVKELLLCMIRDGHRLDASLYGCVMKMYSKRGDLKMVAQLFSESLNAGYIISLDSFAVVMEEFCVKGNILEAEEYIQQIINICEVAHLDNHQRVVNELICKYKNC